MNYVKTRYHYILCTYCSLQNNEHLSWSSSRCYLSNEAPALACLSSKIRYYLKRKCPILHEMHMFCFSIYHLRKQALLDHIYALPVSTMKTYRNNSYLWKYHYLYIKDKTWLHSYPNHRRFHYSFYMIPMEFQCQHLFEEQVEKCYHLLDLNICVVWRYSKGCFNKRLCFLIQRKIFKNRVSPLKVIWNFHLHFRDRINFGNTHLLI